MAGVRLLLFHPGVALISCEDCRKYIYDMEKGERKTYKAGPQREERPMERPAKSKTPCENCPKRSPKEAPEHELTRKNLKAFRLCKRLRASRGFGLTDEMRRDQIVLRNLEIVSDLIDQAERHRLGREIAYEVAKLFADK